MNDVLLQPIFKKSDPFKQDDLIDSKQNHLLLEPYKTFLGAQNEKKCFGNIKSSSGLHNKDCSETFKCLSSCGHEDGFWRKHCGFYERIFPQAPSWISLSFQPLFLFQHLYFSDKMKQQHISLVCCDDMMKWRMRKSVVDSKFFWTTEHLNIFIFTCSSCSWRTTGSISSLSPWFGVLCHTHTNINADANARTQTAAYQEAF